MKITFKGDYALKALLDLSIHFGKAQTIEDVAKRQDIPAKFLEQILLSLKKGGFVKSVRGKKGGYLLSRDPKAITLGDALRYVEGPVEPLACVCKGGEKTCDYSARCALRDVFNDIGKYTAAKVDSVTFADLRDKQIKKEAKHAEYYI
jgi:Rrf2 family transcriptional regulator, cysteine metabolism repressor